MLTVERSLPHNADPVLWSVSELTALGARFVSKNILSSRARSRIAGAKVGYPEAFSIGCFECRLNGDERVDVLVCAVKSDGGQEPWRRCTPPGGVERLLDMWARPRRSALSEVSAVWLEFDVQTDVVAAPFAFLRVAESGSSVPIVSVTAEALRLTLPRGWRARLLAVEKALRLAGKILDFAIVPREGVAIRLHVVLPCDGLLPFLSTIGWTGSLGAWQKLLLAWKHLNKSIAIQIEISDVLEPWLDLEFMLDAPPSRDPRWEPLLHSLGSQPFVMNDKLEAAIAFVEREDPVSLWPLRVVRRLQLKVRISPSDVMTAKAYLAFAPCFDPIFERPGA